MNGDQLLDILGQVDNDLVHEAGQYRKKPLPWKTWLTAAACLTLVCAMAVSYRNFEPAPQTPAVTAPGSSYSGGPFVDNSLLGRPNWFGDGVLPCLRYNGKLYYWEGISKERFTMQGNHDMVYYTCADTSSYLPEGCVEVGQISGCTPDTPTEELQLQAGFETYGPVYQNPDTPEALYAYVANTWGDAGDFYYVRFITDALCDSQLIAWNGSLYRIAVGRTDITPWLKELPREAQVIGQLSFVGEDALPQEDLETNRLTGQYGYPLDGREVLAVPGDDSVIYVYCHRYWAQGDYPAWLACPLWK